jgi:hypothetical protein
MVFIGKNLDAKELAEAFNDCLATPEALEAQRAALRFGVGDAVECRMGAGPDSWSTGTVAALMHRDDLLPEGVVAPYLVELEGGRRVWAPQDHDEVVRSIRRRSGRLRGSGRGADDEPSEDDDEEEHAHGHSAEEDEEPDFRMQCHEGAVPEWSAM